MRRVAVSVVLAAMTALACTSVDVAPEDPVDAESAAAATPFITAERITSPNGALHIELGVDDSGRPHYRIVRSGADTERLVLADSVLGLESSNGPLTTTDTIDALGPPERVEDEFALPHGKARRSRTEATLQTFSIADGLHLDVWVSDTAVAFRYEIPPARGPVTIDWERTSFALPNEGRAWLQTHDTAGLFTPAYESMRSPATSALQPPAAPLGWTFPALFEVDGSWILLTEAGLADGAGGSHLSPAVTEGEYLLDHGARGEGNGVGDPRPSGADGWLSPWRVVITSTDLADIVASDAVRHLSAPPSGTFDWVAPGRVSWSWWSDHASSRDAEQIEPFIELAADLGWEYSLVDANWTDFGRERLAELVDDARARGVGIFVWYNSGGAHNAVTEAPRDRMAEGEVRRDEMAWLAEIGVVGVKVDFFHSDKPATIQLYRDILTDAAAAGLMVNFHGSTTPRGWSREFPNLMTMEAVRGAEIYTFDPSYSAGAPRQNAVLPFTRNVVGSMDYTPVILGEEVRRLTTNGHELALAVVFESALVHFVDTPESYLAQPPEVLELLRDVPTVWDETRLLAGEPGSFVVMARRLGDTWWVGAINGRPEARVVPLAPSELGVDAGSTDMLAVCDDPSWEGTDDLDPTRYRIDQRDTPDQLRLDLIANGGCLIRLQPTS